MLSGIGPASDLQNLGIAEVQDLPGIGQNLQDRLFLELAVVQEPGGHHRTSYITTPEALEQARKEWIQSQSGPLADYYLPQMIEYTKGKGIIASPEFQTLDHTIQWLYQQDTKPFYEIVSVSDLSWSHCIELLSLLVSHYQRVII